MWLAGSRAQALELWCIGLAAPRHVGSSRTRARTHVPCIGRQILNHCATREVLTPILQVRKLRPFASKVTCPESQRWQICPLLPSFPGCV